MACVGSGALYYGNGSDSLCPPFFEERAAGLLQDGGMDATATFFPTGEAQDQELRYPGAICPERAMVMAVDALLASTKAESLSDVSASVGLPECSARCYFNRKTSLFGLVADNRSSLRSRLLPLPPTRTTVDEHWVFFLSVPDLDQHGYWALVARDGSGVETLAEN